MTRDVLPTLKSIEKIFGDKLFVNLVQEALSFQIDPLACHQDLLPVETEILLQPVIGVLGGDGDNDVTAGQHFVQRRK